MFNAACGSMRVAVVVQPVLKVSDEEQREEPDAGDHQGAEPAACQAMKETAITPAIVATMPGMKSSISVTGSIGFIPM